jgi:NitT/TauT family transport system permease protein
MRQRRAFTLQTPIPRPVTWGDAVVLAAVGVLIFAGVRLAIDAPAVVKGPVISLDPQVLPWYAAFSLRRMLGAYTLSVLFTLSYGYLLAYNRRAEQFLMPLLDVLQSVPILSFLPVVLLSFSAILPHAIAAELASIVLIFTSQVWNLTFAWYQSLTTLPKELREAGAIFRFGGWLRFRAVELPFAAVSLIWNSMMSWAGGWFFLMAAEMFTVGQRDYRLPGLGAYLQAAAQQGDLQAVGWGILTLVAVIVALDQLVWRPLLAWADRFKLEMVEAGQPPRSRIYDAWRVSRVAGWVTRGVLPPLLDHLDALLIRRFPPAEKSETTGPVRSGGFYVAALLGGAALLYGAIRAAEMPVFIPSDQWRAIGTGLAATLLRVACSLVIALAWTVPVGVAIGTNARLAAYLQPVTQIAASVPATALLPVFLVALIALPGGLNLAAVLLMLTGTQWYLLFNVIAGAATIPQDLKHTAAMLQLSRIDRWRTLILPALWPYIITGAITAGGGAWNASIVAEHVEFGGRTVTTIGIGAQIAAATVAGNYPLLLASTLTMVLAVVLVNRLVWRRLYRAAQERHRLE